MLAGRATLKVLSRGPFGIKRAEGFVVSASVSFEPFASIENFRFRGTLVSKGFSLIFYVANLHLRHEIFSSIHFSIFLPRFDIYGPRAVRRNAKPSAHASLNPYTAILNDIHP